MYLRPLLSLRFSSLSTGFYLAHVFPPFLLHTIHLCACVLSSTEPWLTQYCRESCESAIAWDHTLPYYSVILKKTSWSQVTAAMPWLFQAFRWWRLCKEMWAQKTTGGIVGGESKGTSPLSSSLSLSSSFFFSLSSFTLHSPTSTPGTGYVLQRIYLSHSVLLST